MADIGIIGLILIITNIAFSYKGFTNEAFFDGYKFEIDRILISKDYKRLITSAFLHVGWLHLIFNMLTLYAFSGLIEFSIGGPRFFVIYFASLLGGSLLSLFIHRNHGNYSSVGASGAVCGIIFATIALYPGIGVGFFGLPVSIPGWLYGVLYVAYSISGIKSKRGGVAHDAHLGGALIGMLVALAFVPDAFLENYLTILIITVPTIVFITLIVKRPHILLVSTLHSKGNKNHYSIDHKYNEEKNNKQKEIDAILDKISRRGMGGLSKREKETLKQYSQTVR